MTALVAALCAAGVSFAAIADARQRTVPCFESIATTRFPYRGSVEKRHRYRVVLRAVSAPPAYLEQVVPIKGRRPWTHFSKRGIVVRNDTAVTITVPRSWRARVGIVWGDNGRGVFSSIRISRCGSAAARGNAYAGGFYLRRSSGCVPLVFAVGGRRRTVWFGVGERCSGRATG